MRNLSIINKSNSLASSQTQTRPTSLYFSLFSSNATFSWEHFLTLPPLRLLTYAVVNAVGNFLGARQVWYNLILEKNHIKCISTTIFLFTRKNTEALKSLVTFPVSRQPIIGESESKLSSIECRSWALKHVTFPSSVTLFLPYLIHYAFIDFSLISALPNCEFFKNDCHLWTLQCLIQGLICCA